MSSSSVMPPPPSPLAHRRSRLNTTNSSRLATEPEATSCAPRKMSLSKAATFHHPSSPKTADDPILSVPHLARRAPTCTRSSFASWLYNGREAAADVIADFEETFSGARGSRGAARRRSARDLDDQLLAKVHRASSPVDSGIGSSIGSPSEKSLSKRLDRALDLVSAKDSALGDSVTGSLTAEDHIQGWLQRCFTMGLSETNTLPEEANQSGAISRHQQSVRRTRNNSLTIIRFVPPQSTNKHITLPALDQRARRILFQRIYSPLLKDKRFKEFQGIVSATRKDRNLRCLRDIEQSLIHKPVVSIVYPPRRRKSNLLRKTDTVTVTPAKYQAFGELTVQLVHDTVDQLVETEQRRASDPEYTTGYFLDLVQQIQQLAAHIGNSSEEKADGEDEPLVEDEVTLEGGLAENGTIAELVRWRNGKGISLRTGLPYEPMAGIKRDASSLNADDVSRSMARRKKGVPPENLQLECSIPGCDKIFNRRCDLSKHEKTHTRPFKCAVPGCKYYELGLPTEKELDRHMNDKHNSDPTYYQCSFCEFKTKRESNCKQHMEKKHDWDYRRVKGRDKHVGSMGTPSAQTPSTNFSPPMNTMDHQSNWDDNSSVAGSIQGSIHSSVHAGTPFEQNFNGDMSMNGQYPGAIFARNDIGSYDQGHMGFNFNAPPTLNTANLNFNQYGMTSPPNTTPASAAHMKFTPQTPAYSTITSSYGGPSPMMHNMDATLGGAGQGIYEAFPTPESAAMHSRSGSVAHDMGSVMDDDFFADGLPTTDFSLSNALNTSAAADQMLFNEGLHGVQEYTPEHFNAVMDTMNWDTNMFDNELEMASDPLDDFTTVNS